MFILLMDKCLFRFLISSKSQFFGTSFVVHIFLSLKKLQHELLPKLRYLLNHKLLLLIYNIWILFPYFRCEDYAISLLEQCEDLREVEIFLQTRNIGTKDANYILAILDAREKFVAHERFQYVLLKKFGKSFFTIIQWFDTALMAMVLLFCVCKMFCSNSIVGRVLSVSISGVRVRLLSALITFHLKYFSTKIVNCQGEAAEIAKLEWFGPWYYFWILAMSFV